jgi:hypothetical protein
MVAWGNPRKPCGAGICWFFRFPHFVREGIENGVYHGDTLKKAGIGGVALYVNGAVGGLMCTIRRWR